MPRYEVETDLVISCRVKVIVDAEDKGTAIEAATDLLPMNADRDAAKKWKATVDLKPPKGVQITDVKAYHFEAASGMEKAKLLK